MSKKLLVAVLLTLVYMFIVGIININFPNSNIRFLLIGISAMLFLLGSQKVNKMLFTKKA